MTLELFDCDGKDYFFNLEKPFDHGYQANIYRIDDGRCLKHFIYMYSECNDKTLRTISDMDLDGFYKIHDILYDKNGKYSAYTMDYYYNDKNLDILTLPVEYTIENFRRLYKSILRLSKEGIRTIDLHSDNIILNNDGIVVIDVDLYSYFSYFDRYSVVDKNVETLYSLFRELYRKMIFNFYNSDKKLDFKIIDDLFVPTDNIDLVCKKLVRYKRPIDYIISERK